MMRERAVMSALLLIFAIFVALPSHVGGVSGSGGYEIDVSWDFTAGDYGGWGNATSDEMSMELTSINDELRCSIVGKSAHLDSPLLFLDVTRRSYIVVRMLYYGESSAAKFLLRSGSRVSGRAHLDHNSAYWGSRLQMQAVDSSATVAGNEMDKISDGDKYTYFLSSQPGGVYVTLDLGDTRWIKELRMLTLGDDNTPKTCLLQRSLTAGSGPFVTVKSFTGEWDISELKEIFSLGYWICVIGPEWFLVYPCLVLSCSTFSVPYRMIHCKA